MSLSEEEQVKEMLASMGVETIDEEELATNRPAEEEDTIADVSESSSVVTPESSSDGPLDQSDLDALFDSPVSTTKNTEQAEKPLISLSEEASQIKTVEHLSQQVSTQGKEFSVSALVHLLGLPTSAQMRTIESKLDSLTAKLNTVSSRVERLSLQSEAAKNESLLERIDFQLSEIRAVLKKSAPLMASTMGLKASAPSSASAEKEEESGPIILTSSPESSKEQEGPKPNTEDDASFQKSESRRVRGGGGLLEE